jgi:hypothetical protein
MSRPEDSDTEEQGGSFVHRGRRKVSGVSRDVAAFSGTSHTVTHDPKVVKR